ncbi:MAG: RHS repeat-associated core domain-containing protein [Ferruginibacter sp.]
MKKKLLLKLMPLALFFFLTIQLQAGRGVPVIQVLDGSLNQLQTDSVAMVMDSAFFNGAYNSILVKPYRVLNNVTLKINETSVYYLQSAFTATVRLRIISTLADLSTVTTDTSLTVNYRADSVYTNRNIYHFQDAYKVEVKVLSVSTNVAWNVWNALVVENQLQPYPAFTFSCTNDAIQSVSHSSLSYGTAADELPVSWGNVITADKYDLEWTYIDTAALAAGTYSTGGVTDPTLIFADNASRVTIAGTQYNIPLFYPDSGTLFFRVRPIQENNNVRKEANWSSDYVSTGGLGRFSFIGHQRNLNWQSTISYAEEGKRKVVVQYYDGSLRSRQTVTKDNTTNTTVVAESIYDYQGRPVIQILPAPTLNTIVGYSKNFNTGLNGVAYDQTHFDEIPDSSYYCTSSGAAMSIDSGASRYYSINNPFRDSGYQQFIPDAGGYPYTETVYTPDNTGRISSQGGVGPNYRIASGHETKYYYGSADQKDLDALFGTDAGDMTHYFKTMVRDANGQYSVSYTDMHGRTIATALAGVLPDSIKLDSLKSRNTRQVTDTLANQASNVIRDLVMESSKSLLVPLAGNNTFTYSLNPQSLTKNDCSATPICYDCLYDLEITITDDCNNQKLGGHAFDTVIHNFSVIDTTCANAPAFSVSFTKFLQEGNYEITKRLSVSRSSMDYYRDSIFTRHNTCKTQATFIAEQKSIQSLVSNCSATCQACTDSLGTWTTFRPKYMLKAGISPADSGSYRDQALQAFTQGQTDCSLVCSTVSESDEVYTAMLNDVTAPSGQYANPDSSAIDIYSIFYTKFDINGVTLTAPAYTLVSGYVDENGKLDTLYDESTGTMVTPEKLSPAAFSAKFKASWAKTVLPKHPEYCKLQQLQLLSASTKWDRDYENTDTYASALAKGYLNPLGITGAQYTRFNGTGGAVADPTTTILSGTFTTIFQNAMKSYLATGTNAYGAGTATTNIWSLASNTVKCAQKGTSCYTGKSIIDSAFSTYMCTADLDMGWRSFRSMYLNTKRHLIDSMQIGTGCPGTTPTPAALIAKYRQPNFGDAKQALANYNIFTPTTASDTTVAKQKAKDAAAVSYNSSCTSYATYWFQQLSGACANYPADSINNVIIPRLIAVCKKGSDFSHPYGSSTIAPDSTNTYNSFQDVIAAYNTAHSITNIYCNAFSITAPKPYGSQVAYSSVPLYGRPDSCTCTRVFDLYNKYQGVKSSYASFSIYLQQVYNTTMSSTDLNTLLSQCSVNGVTNCTYNVTPIQLPAILQCNTGDVCITCTVFKSTNDKFKIQYPGVIPVVDSLVADSAQIVKNGFYAAYMNNQLGFVKSCQNYMQFAADCSIRLAQDSINNLADTCKRFTVIKDFGGTGADVLSDIKQTIDGGYILAGNTTSFGNGGTDAYVIKTDNKGNIQWSRAYGGTLDDNFAVIRQTADSGYIAVGTTKSFHQTKGEVYVIKLKANGDVAWSKGYAQGTANGELGYDIIQTSERGYAVVGLHNYVASSLDMEVLKLDSVGGVTWAQKFGGTNSDNLGGIIEYADTLILAGFSYSSSLTKVGGGAPVNTYYDALVVKMNKANGNIIWAKSYDLNSKSNNVSYILKTQDGFHLDITNLDNFSGGNTSAATIELDRNGSVLRNRILTVPSNGTNGLVHSTMTVDGGYVTSQYKYDATGDVLIYKADALGNISWTNQIKNTAYQGVYALVQNADSSYAGVGADGNRALFIKTNRWGKSYCIDSSLNHPGSTGTVTTYNLSITPTALTFSNTGISVAGINVSTTQTDVCSLNPCAVSGAGPTLCGRADAVMPPVTLDTITNCTDSTFFAVSAGKEYYNVYKDSLNNVFDSSYKALCMQAYKYESFTVTHPVSEYHYTLYYYDQAGSLLRTVPPSGVDVTKFGWAQAWSDSVTVARNNNSMLKPDHVLKTNYRYNTLGQVITQNTPDASDSRFWYDRLGRLVFSQNKKQATVSIPEAGKQYSYTQYDYIGRITEVGQITNAGSTPMTDSISRSKSILSSWLTVSATGKEQISQTVYDLAYAGFTGITPQPTTQRNLRNRVSYITYTDGANPAQYNQGSFFTYDALGNVDTLLQDYGASDISATANVMNANGNRFKKIIYQFDLVSGKVNAVAYQPNQADQFYHRYAYDAENRLTLAETSSDSIVWEKDARYQYYKHGPLARTVMGEQQVQGLDYAYTVQGWLKGVNSTSLQSNYDMGRDGDTTWINRYVAKDAFGFNLNYFTGDYTQISSSAIPFPGYSAYLGSSYKPLYNGNISSMAVNIGQFNNPMLYAYTYDQLNRLTGMNAFNGLNQSTNSYAALTPLNDYQERIAYDGNGNILQYLRNGTSTVNLTMDSLSYKYNRDVNGRLLNNQLNYVRDEINGSSSHSSNYTTDIDDQSLNNYGYDAIGNLIKDDSEHITNISWNAYGKIKEIQKTASSGNPVTDIKYTYDAGGNRISKQVTDNSGNITYTWYNRDATGNVMSTYKSAGTGATLTSYTLKQIEVNLYGSSRIGISNKNIDVKTSYIPGNIAGSQRGFKNYELSNHLGNVLVTLSDRKSGVSTNGITVNSFISDITSATDYHPFGMAMSGRHFNSVGNYRYGFNGKENDNEVKGEGNQQDYGMRIYDPRLGRFLSVDPITKKYPELTPYQFASNRPIDGIDRDGLEYATFRIYVDRNSKVTKIVTTTDYELKKNGTQGPGVEYYIIKSGEAPEGHFEKNNYGIYQGGNNPKLPIVGKNYKDVHDDYSLKPINETDANAKQHDLDFDNAVPGGLQGYEGVVDPRSSKANNDYIKRADKTIQKYDKKEKDDVTGKPVRKEAADAAKFGKKLFKIAEQGKNRKTYSPPVVF